MEDQVLDTSFAQQQAPNANNLVYSTFGSRLLAAIVDGLITGGLVMCVSLISGLSKDIYFITAAIQVIFIIFYHVYLVQASGATPGKRVTGLKIVKLDGSDVGWTEAILRYLPTFLLTLLSLLLTAAAVVAMDAESYEGYSWWERSQALGLHAPTASLVIQGITGLWGLADIITFFATKNNRALHDLIAQTVVISTKG